jgi:quinol-cytochrome oxidoreductase complex cytochrome b subunit
VPYGNIIRNFHYWSAQFLVIFSALHLLRVIFTGSYAPPRRFNYLLGIALFILILFLNFTGYILRWDEGIRWALVAGTNLVKSIPVIGSSLYGFIVGGSKPGDATLIRFYAWHIFGLALFLAVIGVWHLFRVRRDGGIALPPPEYREDTARISRFELVRREVLAALIATIVLLLVSVFFPAPLAPPMSDAGIVSAESRAPWFFLWVQQLLSWGDAFWMGVFIPFVVLLFLTLIPFIFNKFHPDELGTWFPSTQRPVQIIVAILVVIILSLTFLAYRTSL